MKRREAPKPPLDPSDEADLETRAKRDPRVRLGVRTIAEIVALLRSARSKEGQK